MLRRLGSTIRSQWMGAVALFLVISGGSAYALDGSNTVFSGDIVNNQVRAVDVANDTTPYALTGLDIRNESMGGHDVIDNDLKGNDVDESTLGTVPSAMQGGVGRYAFEGSCNPDSTAYVNCAFVPVPLDRAGRVFVSAQVQAESEYHFLESGGCRLEVNGSPIEASETTFHYRSPSGFEDGRENGV